jgi:iron complex outermembrane receptor protein
VIFISGRSPACERVRRAGANSAIFILLAVMIAPQRVAAQALAAESIENLQHLSIDELANLQITSVSKLPESLQNAPAAIFVITHDDIIRSGARRIPEMLRLAPNLEVFQTSPTNWVVTARGLSGNAAAQNFSNKLEVLIDGRTVYDPLFSGVYWDQQDVLPEDIERIEVISGPAATLWGANAVNGVINIITRKSGATQGGYAALSGGPQESEAAVQYGGRIGENFAYRVYAQDFYERGFETPTRSGAHDGWTKPQGGFRLDWTRGDDSVTAEGDLQWGHEQQGGTPASDVQEKNLEFNWQHIVSAGSNLQLLAYYDEVEHSTVSSSGSFSVTNYDVEVQYDFAAGGWNHFLVGAGDRVTPYQINPEIGMVSSLLFVPAARTLNLAYLFVQDTMMPVQNLNVIVGLKMEDDPFSAWSPLPTLRLAWTPKPDLLIWAAVSRAIRAPTPFDVDVQEDSGKTLFLTGNPNFVPEKLTAWELGDRAQWGRVTASVSGFYDQYTDLRSIEFSPGLQLPLVWGNLMDGHIYGMEAWGTFQALSWWRIDAALTLQHEHLGFMDGASGLLGVAQAGDDPHTQARLGSSMDLGAFTFDADFRYVGLLPNPVVPAYVEMNARLAWRISPMTEVAVSGFNLLHAHHQEWTIPPANEIPRMVFLDLRQRF